MTTTGYISKGGNVSGGGISGLPSFVRKLTQQINKNCVVGDVFMTDNSGGAAQTFAVAGNADQLAPYVEFVGQSYFVDVANSGSQLATGATVTTELGLLRSAMTTISTVLNRAAAQLGLPLIAWTGGGTDGNGTVAAIAPTIGGAATGVTTVNSNLIAASIDHAFYDMAALLKRVEIATGDTELYMQTAYLITWPNPVVDSIVGPLYITVGGSASPAVTAVQWTAALTLWQNNIATMAAALNTLNIAFSVPKVLAID